MAEAGRPHGDFQEMPNYLTSAAAAMRVDSTGTHYWVKGEPATKQEWERATWHPYEWVFYGLLEEQQRCGNCYMPPGMCGCCQGCGEPDADVTDHPTGGYCVI